MQRIFTALLCAIFLAAPISTLAEDLPTPTGPVLLTVSGDLPSANEDGVVEFDLEMLQELAHREITTTTIWTDGIQVFEGFPLKALTDLLGVEVGTLRMIAKNDYAIDFPVAELETDIPVVAYLRNGELMSVRDKGPLWLVYPYDSSLDYQTEVVFNRSIWQLDRIVVQGN